MEKKNNDNEDDILYKCFLKYSELMKKNYIYTIDGGIKFKLIFKKANFAHLIGLHKLIDIEIFKSLGEGKNFKKGIADVIFRKISKKEITYNYLENSKYIDEISDRIKYFIDIDDVLFSEILINFDGSKINSKLKSDMILYSKNGQIYLHLCIFNKSGKTYPESFFPRGDNNYIKNQIKKLIRKIEIEDLKTKGIIKTIELKKGA